MTDETMSSIHEGKGSTRIPGVTQASTGSADGVPFAAGGEGQAPQSVPTEQDLWVGRTHWKHFGGRLLVWVLGNVMAAVAVGWGSLRFDWLTFWRALEIIVGLALVSGVVVVGGILWRVLSSRYRVTTQRLFIEKGVFSRTIDQTELIRVDDVRIHKTFLDRVLGLGSVAVVSTDATHRRIVLDGIAEPDRVAEAIRTRMHALRRKSLFIENL